MGHTLGPQKGPVLVPCSGDTAQASSSKPTAGALNGGRVRTPLVPAQWWEQRGGSQALSEVGRRKGMFCCSCWRPFTGPALQSCCRPGSCWSLSTHATVVFSFHAAANHPREPGCPPLSGSCCLVCGQCEAWWTVPRPAASWGKGQSCVGCVRLGCFSRRQSRAWGAWEQWTCALTRAQHVSV